MAKNYEAIREQLAKEITQAEQAGDQRMVLILSARFIDAFPAGDLHPAEGYVRDVFRKKMCMARDALLSVCPVCHGPMYRTPCPDDIIRSQCDHCKRTYSLYGYDDDPNYGKKWISKDWSGMVETSEIITVD